MMMMIIITKGVYPNTTIIVYLAHHNCALLLSRNIDDEDNDDDNVQIDVFQAQVLDKDLSAVTPSAHLNVPTTSCCISSMTTLLQQSDFLETIIALRDAPRSSSS
eukprot:TRINITY_DN4847_c1_g1_i3.p3 TRINITY_DN4847_c1_g1~~TRINITY_DN4847_c1_g1_i3.p3  ORF type:complete len:105 (-),score=24.05 TRINITY_DN4847_c1_g1_i3:464-778(-)